MAERSIAAVLKTVEVYTSGGSNPSLSAQMKVFGLIGRNIHYSFSNKYFSENFLKKNIRNSIYKLFDIENIKKLKEFLRIKKRDLSGLNVTIPYKQNIIHFIDDISPDASNVGEVNTIEIM